MEIKYNLCDRIINTIDGIFRIPIRCKKRGEKIMKKCKKGDSVYFITEDTNIDRTQSSKSFNLDFGGNIVEFIVYGADNVNVDVTEYHNTVYKPGATCRDHLIDTGVKAPVYAAPLLINNTQVGQLFLFGAGTYNDGCYTTDLNSVTTKAVLMTENEVFEAGFMIGNNRGVNVFNCYSYVEWSDDDKIDCGTDPDAWCEANIEIMRKKGIFGVPKKIEYDYANGILAYSCVGTSTEDCEC